jgi:tRNA A-37 threonylcarbamoyl transferase component Bud32/tetratricopeptide (TPR) repeat protein
MSEVLEQLQAALGDRYTVEREIGRGGMAVVYLAQDLRHKRQVALKVLRPELAASLGGERFLREIELAAQLTHPNILPLHDSGDAGGLLYYVMPFVDGESVRARIAREGPLRIGDAVRILRDVADALSHAHGRGVVHRDIKPDNVLLSERHALVTDFGIGKAVSKASSQETLTTAGVSLGTPTYMAPEQATAEKDIDHRADIYALGIVGYEMLVGEPPITGESQQAVLASQVLDQPDPISQRREGLPAPLADLIMGCLEKRREDRWQSAEEIVYRLEALTTPSAGMTPTTVRITAARSARSRRRARRIGLGAGAVAAVAVGVVATVAVLSDGAFSSNLAPDLVAVAALENETGDVSMDPLGRLAAEWITQGVQQRGVAAVVSTEAALAATQASQGLSAADRVGAFAEATGAGVVLHGSYYLLGDSLQFQIQITDAAAGQLLSAMAPVTGPRASASEGMAQLRERTLGALAATLDFRAGALGIPMQPSSLELYRLYRQGEDAATRNEPEQALGFFGDAWAMDPTFLPALLEIGATLQMLDRDAEADSVLGIAEGYRERMSEVERLRLQLLIETDVELRLRTLRRMAELARPWSYDAAEAAWNANRPRETLEHLALVDTANPNFIEAVAYWDLTGLAHHLLEDYREELVVLRAARRQWPDELVLLNGHLRALAALGRTEDVDALLDTVFALPTERQAYGFTYSPVYRAQTAAVELRAHGHVAASGTVLDRAIEWQESRPQDVSQQYGLAQLLYFADRWEEARVVVEGLRAQDPDDTGLRAARASIAARLGDTEPARVMGEVLSADTAVPRTAVFQAPAGASLAALRGEREEAVRLLRDAYGAYPVRGRLILVIHRSVDFESLRDFMPFQQFMRPRG